jgi:hypothetical protein
MTPYSRASVFWIDDDPSRRKDAEHMEKLLEEETAKEHVALNVKFLTGEDWAKFTAKPGFRKSHVDLFLLDYVFFIKGLPTRRGLSIAGEIRENFPNVPIYMFSAKGVVPQVAESFADSVMDLKDIQRRPAIVYYDVMDYQKISKLPRRLPSGVFDLFKAPDRDRERMVLAFPEDIKKLLSHPDESFNPLNFAKWMKHTFLRLPGFVYNSLYSATMLGMTEKTFIQLSSEFDDAKYRGVFSRTSPNLWWVSRLKDIVFQIATEKMPEKDTTDISELTPLVFGIGQSKTSKCAVCGKRYPETVGIDDDGRMYPVHYKCSVPHPEKTRVLFFDEERKLAPKED